MGKGIFKIIMISFLLLGADMAQVRSAAPTDFENTGKIQLNPVLVSTDIGKKNVAKNLGEGNMRLTGKLVRYGDNLTFSGVANAGKELVIDVTELGYYTLELTLADNENIIQTTVVNYAVVPEIIDEERPWDMGVCVHPPKDNDYSKTFRLIRMAGFTRIRTDLAWEHVEPAKGKYVMPEHMYQFVSASEKEGIKPLIVFGYANAIAYPNGFPTIPFPTTEESRLGCANALAYAVKEMGNRVTEWELWNEPNYADPVKDYLPLLKVVYPTVKKVNPDITLISGGGSGAGGGPGGAFIIPVLDAGGVDFQDGYSIHPYMAPNTPDFGYAGTGGPIPAVNIPTVWPYLKKISEENLRSDKKELSVWVTEIGWNSTTNLDIEQAAYLARTYLLSRRHYMSPGVFWYDFQNDGDTPDNIEHNFGLLRSDFSPKPSYQAAAVVASLLKNYTFQETLLDGVNKVLAFGQDGETTFYTAWTTKAERTTIRVKAPTDVDKLRLIDWQGCEMPLTVDNGYLVLNLSILPQYLVVKEEVVGITSPVGKAGIKLYPNPSTGLLIVNWGHEGNRTITINDLNGRILQRKVTYGLETQMNISDLNAGIYMLCVNDGKEQVTLKVIKQ